MKELIIDRIVKHWDDSLVEIFDIYPEDLYNLTDQQLLDLYDTIFELGLNC
jgi:hypothetical protein